MIDHGSQSHVATRRDMDIETEDVRGQFNLYKVTANSEVGEAWQLIYNLRLARSPLRDVAARCEQNVRLLPLGGVSCCNAKASSGLGALGTPAVAWPQTGRYGWSFFAWSADLAFALARIRTQQAEHPFLSNQVASMTSIANPSSSKNSCASNHSYEGTYAAWITT